MCCTNILENIFTIENANNTFKSGVIKRNKSNHQILYEKTSLKRSEQYLNRFNICKYILAGRDCPVSG